MAGSVARGGDEVSDTHESSEVQQALVRLNDALCTWERNTGRESVLILREEGGYEHRSVSGKPVQLPDVTDEQLMEMVI